MEVDAVKDVVIPPASGTQGPLTILARLLEELPYPTRRGDVVDALGGVLLPVQVHDERAVPATRLLSRIPDRAYRAAADVMAEVSRIAPPFLTDPKTADDHPASWQKG